jgi:hypothetical protein
VLPALVYAYWSEWTRGWRSQPNRAEGEHPSLGTGKFEIAFEFLIVVYVEMALKWNHISGVHTLSVPGQFMPLFIALAQLVTTFYRVGKYALIQSIEGPEGIFKFCRYEIVYLILTFDFQDTRMNVRITKMKRRQMVP